MASDVDDLFAEMGAPALTESMGETVTQYPLGDTASPLTLENVIVDLSDQGDVPVDDEHGSQAVRWGTLTLAASVVVNDAERGEQRDQFMVRSKIWHCEKVISKTLSLQTVRIKRTEAASTKRTRLT